MRARLCVAGAAVLLLTAAGGCSRGSSPEQLPGLDSRGTVETTVKPTRMDITDKMSLTASVTVNPVFGLEAPVAGEVQFYDLAWPGSTPTQPTTAANVWVDGNKTPVAIPAGASFAGRLVPDHTTVAAGTPIVSARWAGYGIVAEIQPTDAYRIVDNLTTVQAQIANGPGPFDCTVLGTIAALPAGTVPDPAPFVPNPDDPPETQAAKQAAYEEWAAADARYRPQPSEPTGMRVVCLAPDSVRLISGAQATVQVITASATNALVLPVAAVAGREGTGKVTVVLPDGSTEVRDVTLGLTDGEYIEIKSGLTGDETIAVPGPNLPPGQGGGADQTGGPGVVIKR